MVYTENDILTLNNHTNKPFLDETGIEGNIIQAQAWHHSVCLYTTSLLFGNL